jgi:hypothetical protein
MKHVKPPKQKSWIVVRYPANSERVIHGVKSYGEDAILDGYYNNYEEVLDVAEDWHIQYPAPQWKVSVICNDGTLGYPPPDWDPNSGDKAGFDAIIARSNAAMAKAREQRLKKSNGGGYDELDKLIEQTIKHDEEQQKLEQQVSMLGVWDAGDDLDVPPPRGWLLGNVFCRSFVSSLFGDGGTGKTSVRYAQLLSLAIGRSLTGEHVFQRCRVLIVSLEDDEAELRRRIHALCLHYEIDREELKGWLFLAAPGRRAGKLLFQDPRGRVTPGYAGAQARSRYHLV